jgi:hypothetical protein
MHSHGWELLVQARSLLWMMQHPLAFYYIVGVRP